MSDARTLVAAGEALAGADALPQLFEDFSRVTAGLVAAHDALLLEVERLNAELAAKNRRLEHKKRLEAIGRVAAGVAHEFRNPLGGIQLNADCLRRQHPTGPSTRRIDQITEAVQHLDRIVDDLLTYTRPAGTERSLQPVGELVTHALRLAFADLGEQRFTLVHDGPPWLEVQVDRVGLSQALVNLLVNARQAVESLAENGAIGIFWGLHAGRFWLEVADNGAGIPVGEEERIFHPFHTLREGGTGLGLAIVQSRVEVHDGEIAVVRDAWGGHPEWTGARFRLLLPLPTGRDPKAGEEGE
ncbi:MAG: PAS domain-containing sensor histidine kinase [Planctomycetota bacterium]